MDQQEQSCRKHDFFVQSTNELFLRTCLSCGFVEEFQLSQTKQRVDRWQGWLSAKTRRLSWPPGVNYSEADPETLTYVYSYRPNMQTSLENQPQIDVGLCLVSRMNIMLSTMDRETLMSTVTCPKPPAFGYWSYCRATDSILSVGVYSRSIWNKRSVLRILPCPILGQMTRAIRHFHVSYFWIKSRRFCILRATAIELYEAYVRGISQSYYGSIPSASTSHPLQRGLIRLA